MEIILIGDSGHAKVIRECVESNGYKIVAILDDKYQGIYFENEVLKGPIDELVYELIKKNDRKLVISIGDNEIRKRIVNRLALPDDSYASILHNNTLISNTAKIGVGTVVMPGVVVNADTQIGDHCIVNTNTVVEHDCIIDDFVHFSPNCTITGGVKVEEGVHLGAGSTVIPLKEIMKWTIVGAGSVVIDNLPSYCTAVGIPAKPIKFHELQ
ncbi:acetyltransferase [Ureibacillus sp. GCM10028918]|uniref:acetyltransferase n=1 Tax=Ureibacillus sp. GCM10028918 TaxID=3273429 RepID=UPI0036F20395